MYQVLLIVYLIVSIMLIGLVLIQQGKGANVGASFGGASNTMFGSGGSANFLSRTTAILAIVFFITCLAIANINSHKGNTGQGKFDNLSQVAEDIQDKATATKFEEKQNQDIPQ